MQIKIPLILPDTQNGTYEELKASLKQLELSVHHAQKAVESAEKNGIVLADGGISYATIKDDSVKEELEDTVETPIIYINLDQKGEL